MLLYDRLVENNWLFNASLWDSNRSQLFISGPSPGHIFLLMLAFFLLAIVVLGFGFYLWFFITSNEHTQVRLLNILNVYFSVICIGGGITTFTRIVTSGLGNPVTSMEHILVGFHMGAISATLFLISLATFLKQLKPEVYLELSVAWRHSVALPTMLLFFVTVASLIFYHCHVSLEDECTKITIRRCVLIPSTCISCTLQSIVLIDDVWGIKNITNFVIPTTNETLVVHLQNPTHCLQNHVVSNISIIGSILLLRPHFRNISPYQLGSLPFSSSP